MESGFETQISSEDHQSLMDTGLGKFGYNFKFINFVEPIIFPLFLLILFFFRCSHYRRRCKIRAPCCDEIFDCRHCHNEAKVCVCLCFSFSLKVIRMRILGLIFETEYAWSWGSQSTWGSSPWTEKG